MTIEDDLIEMHADLGVDAAWESGAGSREAAGAFMAARARLGQILRKRGIEVTPYPLDVRSMAEAERRRALEAAGSSEGAG